MKLAIARATATDVGSFDGDVECAEGNTASPRSREARRERSRKIAIIEDFVELSKIYSVALSLQGHEVVFLGRTGEEAVKALSLCRFGSVECAIIDYKMRGPLDGLEVANRISNSNPDVRIAVASADFSIKETVENIGVQVFDKTVCNERASRLD